MTPDEARDRVQAIVDGMTLPVPWQARVFLHFQPLIDYGPLPPDVVLEVRRPEWLEPVSTWRYLTHRPVAYRYALTLEFVRDTLYLEAIVQDTVDRIIRENSPWLTPPAPHCVHCGSTIFTPTAAGLVCSNCGQPAKVTPAPMPMET